MHLRQDPKTAILVFANSSTKELQNKPIAQGEILFEALTLQTLKIIRKSGLPYFHYTEREQKGLSFRERFVNALSAIFEKGYDNVISVGNDTPHLQASDIEYAHRQLLKKKLVLGPSADGGIYLLGIHKSSFNKSDFLQLPWQCADLCASLEHMISSHREVIKLRTLFDLDSAKDLSLLVSRFNNLSRELIAIILAIINPGMRNMLQFLTFYDPIFPSLYFNKGSPVFMISE